VYFSSPAPAANLPGLPGKSVLEVQALTTGTPAMVGEFDGPGGAKYAMLVNLSLQRSEKFAVKLAGGVTMERLRQISPVDARPAPLDMADGIWLAAGQGVLLRIK
jgi:hypothetical protein